MHKNGLNELFSNECDAELTNSMIRLQQIAVNWMGKLSLSNDTKYTLFLTQSYCMNLEDLEYRAQVVWTTFVILL